MALKKLGIALAAGVLPAFLLAGALLLLFEKKSFSTSREANPPEIALAPLPPEARAAEVRRFCIACHAVPDPDTFPRAHWRKEIAQGYDFLRESALALDYPSLESVVRYYESRAPLERPFIVP